uniref:NADH-ubiquinone oxidoreductase chain 3 n=1 Tax=Eustenogaster scitula TaxID=1980568 RepID=A0A509ZWT2_9HYME|nr:NADH dehydrogenase subunit 3 [Eustenogaster scitula]ARO89844.1 NADH dehydrogenase subunit 3 [Eustenogaster scitula]
MNMFIMIFIINIMISMLIFMINKTFFFKTFFNREKASSYECGFDPKSMQTLPLSIKFYLIMLIFMIFDLELSFIIPLILSSKFKFFMMMNLSPLMMILMITFIIMILFFGLLWEMYDSSLKWI